MERNNNTPSPCLGGPQIPGIPKGIDSIAAIIPAYNEAERIGEVLGVLTRTARIREIIVVDDCSTDNTAEVVLKFRTVKLLRNSRNRGKSYSLERGVNATDAKILFFCDADLRGLTPRIVSQTIQPVIDGEVGMFIAVRNNIMQKSIRWIALYSGERALTRTTWECLPPRFKHRFRVEVGLNHVAGRHGSGFGYAIMPVYQTVKEIKYGVLHGTVRRWWMIYDIFCALLLVGLCRGRNAILAMAP